MNNITVVYNTGSGRAKLAAIKQAFTDQGVNPTYISITSRKLAQTLRRTATSRAAVIVAAGGDGTVNAVASYIYKTPASLGVIPVGTLNHFAKALNLPLDTTGAIKIILQGKRRHVDIGTVNKLAFVNNSSIGFYPRSLLIRDEFGERLGKWPAAILGYLHALIRPHHYRVEITTPDKQHTVRTPFVFIGNNKYRHTPPNIGERDTLESGQLAVYAIKTTSPIGIIRILTRALFTRKRYSQDLDVYLTTSCTIRTRRHRRIHVACDGEVKITSTPLTYRSEPRALRVLIP